MIRKDDSSQQKAKRLPQVRELPRGEEGYIEPGGFLFSFVMGVMTSVLLSYFLRR